MPEDHKTPEVDLAPLRALSNEPPPITTLIAQVRRAWPDIQSALAAGHSLTAVHQRLTRGGLSIPYPTFRCYVARIRWEKTLHDDAERERDRRQEKK